MSSIDKIIKEVLAEKSDGILKTSVDYIGRKLKIKITKGKPNLKNAPRWAKALGQTPEGAWHWLEKNGPIETNNSNNYFPLSGKTEFTGFVSKYEGAKKSMSLEQIIESITNLDNPEAIYNSIINTSSGRPKRKIFGEWVFDP